MKLTVGKILLLPIYLLAVFSTSKSFNQPIIGSKVLNTLGLHVARILASRAIYRFKQFFLSFLVSKTDRKEFAKKGFIVRGNFLPPQHFKELDEELRNYDKSAHESREGDTLTRRLYLTDEVAADLPAFKALSRHKDYRRLLAYTGATCSVADSFAEMVLHGVTEGDSDPQKDVHKDTFHPTMKSWLFLDDVVDDNGPFHYIPGSHRLTWKRIKWEYRKSVEKCSGKAPRGGAFRLNEDDCEFMGLPKPVAMKVPKNSLVIADTMGFHCRGKALADQKRLAVFAMARVNPFNPIPGLPSNTLRRLRQRIYMSYLKHREKKRGKGRLLGPYPVERWNDW